ncbi:MAG: zinc ribbon domain-containing protein [Desulfococcaceae bacterium]|jgi:putative FmdB family regulatory protein|nr:zinc ribbon domain-containing protein [Desulfococcaceae bacterium]
MPIYEYHCDQCDKNFECLMFRSDDVPECPDCKGNHVRKMMSACGFLSKGGGGETVSRSAGASSCGGCTASSCAGCGH